MSNCSEHKKEVAGISDMKVLAEMIGDLHYESLAEFLDMLSDKISVDALKDYQAGRLNLSKLLTEASLALSIACDNISQAFEISKSFMKQQLECAACGRNINHCVCL